MMGSLAKPSEARGALGPRVAEIHTCIRQLYPRVERVAVALYDSRSDKLSTFVHSTDGESPLNHYQALLADVPSLWDMARSGEDRVIDDLSVFRASAHEHSQRLLAKGYRSSYALPLRDDDDRLWGFMFFDSSEVGYFSPRVRDQLAAFGRLGASILADSLSSGHMLHSILRVASRLTHYRDPETSAHLERMARYTRLIAQGLASREGLSDEFVEFLFIFAPAHDIGKIAIPDSVLFKRGRLTQGEFAVMKTHVSRGAEIVDGILKDLKIDVLAHGDILRNVVLFHHEAVDGSGYPEGRSGDDIPIEARIVAVADVFDALTSRRCYKKPWRTDEALTYLMDRTGTQFAEPCVAALKAEQDGIDAVRLLFPDEESDSYQSREGYDPGL